MSNDYFNNDSPIGQNTKARSADVRTKFNAIAAGFDKLPDKSNLEQGKVIYAVGAGSANTYTAAMPATLTAYAAGQHFRIQIPATNTGASTLNVDGLGARAVRRIDGTDVEAGDLTAGDIVDLVYNGTSMVVLGTYRSHMAGMAANLGANLVFSGNPSFTGSPNFASAGNKSTIRQDLGLKIGTDVQAFNDKLQSLSGLSGAADRLPYLSAASTFALATLTSFARTLLDDANASTARGTLELGDAATKTVQTSPTDTTSGRVLTVGAFGLGAGGTSTPEITDFTAAIENGMYRFNGATVVGGPSTVTGEGVAVVTKGANNRTNIIAMDGANSSSHVITFGSRNGNTGAIAWTPLVHTGNLLGSVSQSGGVPTGAVIERGSNSNGEYVRFADGTQICTHSKTVSVTTAATGAIYNSLSDYGTWTFPATYTAAPEVVLNAKSSSVWANATSVTATQVTAAVIWSATSLTSASRSISAIAVGRWF